jgi:hypothetical protein
MFPSRLVLVFPLALVACSGSKSEVTVEDPNDQGRTVAVTKDVFTLCGLICDTLVEDYNVPNEQQEGCVFQCSSGFNKTPQACYELVSCIRQNTLCVDGDVSGACETNAGPCFAEWSLANGLCRSCWAPSGTVTGMRTIVYRTDVGEILQPVNLSQTTVAAHLPTVNESWKQFSGSGDALGHLTIAGVPGCGYWLQIGNDLEWMTSLNVDSRTVILGRPDVRVSTNQSPTIIQLEASGLLPWQLDTSIELFVPGIAGFAGWGSAFGGGPISAQVGSSSVSLSLNWSDFTSALPESSKGDRGYFLVYEPQQRQESITYTANRFLIVDNFSLNDGVSNTIAGTFTALQSSTSILLDVRRTEFAALTSQFNSSDGQGASNFGVDIHTYPREVSENRTGPTADLFYAFGPIEGPDILLPDTQFWTPFPSDWPVSIYTSLLSFREYASGPDPLDRVTFTQRVETRVPVEALGSDPIRPVVSPVRDLAIDGQTALVSTIQISTRPTITWSSPEVGTPSTVTVRVFRIDPGARGRLSPIATFRTRENRIRIPPNLLQVGDAPYVLEIEARVEPSSATSFRSGEAAVVTGTLTPIERAPAPDAGTAAIDSPGEAFDASVPQREGDAGTTGPGGDGSVQLPPDAGAVPCIECQVIETGCRCLERCVGAGEMFCNGTDCMCLTGDGTAQNFPQADWCNINSGEDAFRMFCGAP